MGGIFGLPKGTQDESKNGPSSNLGNIGSTVDRSYGHVGLSSNSCTQSSSEKLFSSLNPVPLRTTPPISSSKHSQSPVLPKIHTSKPSYSSSKPSPQVTSHSLNPYPSFLKIPKSSSNPPPSFPKPEASASSASKALPSFKLTLAPASSKLNDFQEKVNYVLVQKDTTPIYAIPQDFQDLIKRDIVPEILKRPLSLSSYKDYFAALLYAEDYYIEKWSEFELVDIPLTIKKAVISKGPDSRVSDEKDDKIFVAFQFHSSGEKRPFLLSRDFVFARPSGSKTKTFQGILYRVVKSATVLAEFGEDFYAQHHPSRKYDVSFSFNRVCLKRAHQAIEAASDLLFERLIFPGWSLREILPSPSSNVYYNNKLEPDQNSAVRQVITMQGLPPYLIEGPLCVAKTKYSSSNQLSKTGSVVLQSVLEIFRSSQNHRILICAPINSTCDFLMTSLKEVPENEKFRANAAFREIDGLPTDILASSLYTGECFTCPPVEELRKFKVVFSTYVSSFRLHREGIAAGHFSHIFMVDASSATEPEAMVALANLANENTVVIVTGSPTNNPAWVRSDIARKNGLKVSYFERLRLRNPYNNLHPNFITELAPGGLSANSSDDINHSFSFSLV